MAVLLAPWACARGAGVRVGMGLVQQRFESDGVIDLGFTEDLGEAEGKQPREHAGQHAPDQEGPDHLPMLSSSMAGEAEQMASVMDEFVEIHAGDQ